MILLEVKLIMDIHGKKYINKSKIIMIYYYIKSSNNIIYLFVFSPLYYYKCIIDNALVIQSLYV